MPRTIYALASLMLLVVVTVAGQVPLAPTAEAAQPLTGSHRFSGRLTIDGDSAPTGVTVLARIGSQECGRARISQQGRYSVEVAGGMQT